MPTKKKDSGVEAGVEIRTSASRLVNRYEDGVSVHTTDAPAQTAGADDGQSAGSKKEKN